MLKTIKVIKASYQKELLKQKKPYEYYLTYVDSELKGEDEPHPFVNIGHMRRYDYGDYYVYEEENGHANEAERKYLLTFSRKLNADYVFSDIDFENDKNEKQLVFYKPDFDRDTYEAFDYVSDFYAVKKELNKTPIENLDKISHVTKVLYHSFYGKDEKIQPAIEFINNKYNRKYITPDYYSDNSITGEIINIVIPSRNNPDRLLKCLEGISKAKIKSKFNILNMHIIDNGSTPENVDKITSVIEKYQNVDGLNIDYTYELEEFNFSKMCNAGAKKCEKGYLLFMNDDIEITDEDFLVKLLYYARKSHVGAVGCKLLYPDGKTIQHIGITDLKYAGPSHKLSTFEDNTSLYFGRNLGVHNCLAVTAACLMVSYDKFFKTGGFCDKMKVGYNDVDLCVSLYENGYHNIVNNDLTLIHHESVTRGTDAGSLNKLKRLKEERELLYERHPFLKETGDPYYNENLAGDFLEYCVNVIPEFEYRDYISTCTDICEKDFIRRKASAFLSSYKPFKHLHYNIESVKAGINAETLKQYIEIKGWALINKHDNAFYETYLCVSGDIIERSSADLIYATSPVYREDLQTVFPEAENAELSGFLARIDPDTFNLSSIDINELIEKLRIGVLLKNKLTRRIFYGQPEQPDI